MDKKTEQHQTKAILAFSSKISGEIEASSSSRAGEKVPGPLTSGRAIASSEAMVKDRRLKKKEQR